MLLEVLLLLTGQLAAEGPERLSLSYERGAPQCPDSEAFRSLVAARLGRDVFADSGSTRLEVVFLPRPQGFAATLTLQSAQGKVLGRRQFEERRSCPELAASLSVAAAIAIDPLVPKSTEPVPPATPLVSSTGTPPAEAAPPPTSKPPSAEVASSGSTPSDEAGPAPLRTASDSWRWGFGLGSHLDVGSLPAPAAGLWGGARVRWGHASAALELRANLPASKPVGSGRVEAFSVLGTFAPCAHLGPFGGCLTASAGGLQIRGLELPNASGRLALHAELGARLMAEWSLHEGWGLRVFASVGVPLTRSSARYSSDEVWRVPWLSGQAGLGVTYQP